MWLLLLALLMATDLELAQGRVREWRHNPQKFVWDHFGATPDRWQSDVLDAFVSTNPVKDRIAMQACAGPGKSAVLGWAGWHFLLCRGRPNEHPNGYAISITGDNLRDNLWKELAVWRGRSRELTAAFDQTSEKIFARDHPDTWWLKARSWPKTADADAQGRTLSGLHSRFILYLIDESGDIPPSVLRAAEQGLSNCEWGKILQAGNPTSLEGMLFDSVNNQSHKWFVVRITGDPDDPKRSTRIDIGWAREQIATYGRENAWVKAYVLGLFPPSSLNTLLGPDEVRDAIGRGVREDAFEHVQKRIGTDVARFGDDRTVHFPRQGLVAFTPVIQRNARTNEIGDRIMLGKQKWGSEMEFIDDTGGWAAGVVDHCLMSGVSLYPVNFSGSPNDPRYFNKRSELHFLAALWVRRGASLPEGLPDLVREATAARYWFDKGKLRVEEKDQIKKRLGFSPDLWDALLTTFALPDMPAGGLSAALAGGGGMKSDYDPLAQREGGIS
jgi:phage terminase large subunit